MYRLQATIGTSQSVITWDDGDVSSSDIDVQFLKDIAADMPDVQIGTFYDDASNWQDGATFYGFMSRIADDLRVISGDVPKIPVIPDGAVA